jgi:hypothetical protein
MMVSLPGVTSCQLVWVAVDGQFEPVVALLVPPVPQPASVSNASDAAMTMPPTLRNAILECEGAECVCRESMSDLPPTVDAGDEWKNGDAAQRATLARKLGAHSMRGRSWRKCIT